MPNKKNKNNQKKIEQKIKKINRAFGKFENEINKIKREQADIIEEIFKRIDKEKMEKILQDIQQAKK